MNPDFLKNMISSIMEGLKNMFSEGGFNFGGLFSATNNFSQGLGYSENLSHFSGGFGKVFKPANGTISSEFANRREGHAHQGVDVAGRENSKVQAFADGKVLQTGFEKGYGNYVILGHVNKDGQQMMTLYGHLNRINVKKGQAIEGGRQIGLLGNTGHSHGAHLHFEVAVKDGRVMRLLNPEDVVNGRFDITRKSGVQKALAHAKEDLVHHGHGHKINDVKYGISGEMGKYISSLNGFATQIADLSRKNNNAPKASSLTAASKASAQIARIEKFVPGYGKWLEKAIPNQRDRQILMQISAIESPTGNPNKFNIKGSGAAGLFQFMPETAKGSLAHNRTDPKATTLAAYKLMNQNRAALKGSIGHDPSAVELYLAHQQGVNQAIRMINNPNMRAVETSNKSFIASNLPSSYKHLLNTITSEKFMKIYADKIIDPHHGYAAKASSNVVAFNKPASPNNTIAAVVPTIDQQKLVGYGMTA
jgi:hypothetical protein